MKYTIFDLDGTVIDSSHRSMFDPITGKTNLEFWRENSTRAKIMKDSLMPLAKVWHKIIPKAGKRIVICTARVLTHIDYEFLRTKGLFADAIFSRPEGDMTADADLKISQIMPFLAAQKDVDSVKFWDQCIC